MSSELSNQPATIGAYTRLLHNFIQSSRGEHTMSWEETQQDEGGQPIWIVTVKVDGETMGSASGTRKNVAKDLAAREAWGRIKRPE